MPSRVDDSKTEFRPRQASYLRISPRQVLQLVMYLEPAHVNWMTDDRLDRVLHALKERIPTKLRKEETHGKRKTSVAKEKTQVDVYRGSDYQMAYFFRRAGKKHVVMLKDKRLIYPEPVVMQANVQTKTRHTHGAPQTDGEVVIKAEDEETSISVPEEGNIIGQMATDAGDVDAKPELQVNYQSYTIFNRCLVVIIEPYPALPATHSAYKRALAGDEEVRQLSATPFETAPAVGGRQTPIVPARGALFRSESVVHGGQDLALLRPAMREGEAGPSRDGGPTLFPIFNTTRPSRPSIAAPVRSVSAPDVSATAAATATDGRAGSTTAQRQLQGSASSDDALRRERDNASLTAGEASNRISGLPTEEQPRASTGLKATQLGKRPVRASAVEEDPTPSSRSQPRASATFADSKRTLHTTRTTIAAPFASDIPVIVIPDSPPRPPRPAKAKRRLPPDPDARWPDRIEHGRCLDESHQAHDSTPAPHRWLPRVPLAEFSDNSASSSAVRRLSDVSWQDATAKRRVVLSSASPGQLSTLERNEMWSALYRPRSAAEILGAHSNASAQCFREWLARQGLERSRLAVKKAVAKKVAKRKAGKELDDFVVFDEDDLDYDETASDLGVEQDLNSSRSVMLSTASTSNVVLLSGPVGSGKTATVYAVAHELGWNVLEMNPGAKRSGKDIERLVGNLGQNHTVTALKASRSTLQSAPGASGPSPSNVQASDRTLILLEEVDVLYRDDKDFWSGVREAAQHSMRPLVLTCDDLCRMPWQELELQTVVIEGSRAQHLPFAAPEVDEVHDTIRAVLATEGKLPHHPLQSSSKYIDVVSQRQTDIRHRLNQLQFETRLFNPRTPVATVVEDDFNLDVEQLSVVDILRNAARRAGTSLVRVSEEDHLIGYISLVAHGACTHPEPGPWLMSAPATALHRKIEANAAVHAEKALRILSYVSAIDDRTVLKADEPDYLSYLRDITLADDAHATVPHDSLGGATSHGMRRSLRLAGNAHVRRINWLQQHADFLRASALRGLDPPRQAFSTEPPLIDRANEEVHPVKASEALA
ncbi:hypothetical protein ACM66B_001074 [Microbotryomycetes sp. NB124-2]